MSIDPRLAERRRVVAEDRANRSVRRLLRFLLGVGVLGLGVWFVLSPYMSIAELEIDGVEASDAAGILASESVVVGRPLVLVRTAALEEALEEDPWVSEATVTRHWPNRIAVAVTERVPRAWVETSDGWSRRAGDGVAVPSAAEPDNTLGWVSLPGISSDEASSRQEVLGAVEFLMALGEDLAASSSMRMEEGEMWAVVGGWQVRLGRPVDMRQKAVSLVALLEQELEPGSVIVLIAPTHPSVDAPGDGTGGVDTGEGGE